MNVVYPLEVKGDISVTRVKNLGLNHTINNSISGVTKMKAL